MLLVSYLPLCALGIEFLQPKSWILWLLRRSHKTVVFLESVYCFSEHNALVCFCRCTALSLGTENARLKVYLGPGLYSLIRRNEMVGLRIYQKPFFRKTVIAGAFFEQQYFTILDPDIVTKINCADRHTFK